MLDLVELYGGSRCRRNVADVVRERHCMRRRDGLAGEMRGLMDDIVERAERYECGGHVRVRACWRGCGRGCVCKGEDVGLGVGVGVCTYRIPEQEV